MKKTKFFAALLLFLYFGLLQAQKQPLPIEKANLLKPSEKTACGTAPMTAEQRRYTLEVIDQAGADRNAGTTCIPIRIHIVREDDQSGGISLGDINIGMSYLNYFYLTAGIEFYICGVNYIDDSDWYDFDDTEEGALTAAHSVDDAVNIFFVGDINSGAWCGYAYYPWDADYSINVMMKNSCTTSYENGTLVHEMGHFFDLQHTHDGTENGNTDSDAEHVPRSGGNSNCTTDGDMLCDTEADPNGSNDGGCNFINDGVDTEDIYMNTYAPDLDNIMSYYSDYCGGSFTAGQYTRIANGLTTRLAHTAYDLDGCSPATVTDPSGLSAGLNNSYGVDLTWTDNAGNETGYLIERSSDGGTTWAALSGGGVAPDVTTYTDNTVVANTTYDYRVKASNDDCNDYSGTTSIAVGLVYCVPTQQSNSCDQGGGLGVAIYNFLLEETSGTDLIDNNANGCTGALSVFSNTYSAAVTAGTTYDFEANFQLNTPPSGSYYSQYVTIWVDDNRDGDFEDTGETLYQASSAGGPTVSGSITIPATAINGTTTLRVRSGWSGGGQISDPCNYHALSEAEDYELVISGGVLPVELTSFSGYKRNDAVELKWSTASEENNDYFIVERSDNGVDFEFLAKQKGNGTSFESNNYNLLDRHPLNGFNYYRLVQIDFDGTKHIEDKIVAVEFTKSAFVSVSPNPIQDNIIAINYQTEQTNNCLISIFDLNGRSLYQTAETINKGGNMFNINLPNLPKGVYIVRVDSENEVQTARFIKAR